MFIYHLLVECAEELAAAGDDAERTEDDEPYHEELEDVVA